MDAHHLFENYLRRSPYFTRTRCPPAMVPPMKNGPAPDATGECGRGRGRFRWAETSKPSPPPPHSSCYVRSFSSVTLESMRTYYPVLFFPPTTAVSPRLGSAGTRKAPEHKGHFSNCPADWSG